jgi:hypothetical protein
MPRTVRPFGDRARPDPKGNVVPYDTPTTAEVLERFGNGEGPVCPATLVNDVDIELAPFALGAVHTILGTAAPYRDPELILPAEPRRGAISLWAVGGGSGGAGWRIGRSAQDVLRDDSSLLIIANNVFGNPVPATLRVAWRGPMWAVQWRGGASERLIIVTEDWAR